LALYAVKWSLGLFNTGFLFDQIPFSDAFAHTITIGCVLGLFIGKPLGIGIASYLAVRFGVATLPTQVRWVHITGAGMLGGIGFTMSLNISGLSFADVQFLNIPNWEFYQAPYSPR